MNEITRIEEGQIVWAKLKGYEWWPGMIVPASLCRAMIGHKDVTLCLYWYGDNSVSEVERSLRMCDFAGGFNKFNKKNKTKPFKYGVMQAAKDLMLLQKQSLHEHVNHQEINAWLSSDDFQCLNIKHGEWALSVFVQDQLQLLSARFSSEGNGQTIPKATKSTSENLQLKEFYNGSLCFNCGSVYTESFLDHPIFEKRICSLCVETFKQNYFVPKANGILKHHFSESLHRGSVCFLCDKTSLRIPIRSCWRQNVLDVFYPRIHNESEIVASETHRNVLCLYTCYSAGEALNSHFIKAMGITNFNLFLCGLLSRPGDATESAVHSRNIEKALNCSVTYLSNIETLSSMSPSVNMNYIVSSITGDCSNDVGPHFFEFFQIIDMIKGSKWLLQMQVPFCKKYIILISRFLECEPGLWHRSDSPKNCTWTNEQSLLRLLQEVEAD